MARKKPEGWPRNVVLAFDQLFDPVGLSTAAMSPDAIKAAAEDLARSYQQDYQQQRVPFRHANEGFDQVLFGERYLGAPVRTSPWRTGARVRREDPPQPPAVARRETVTFPELLGAALVLSTWLPRFRYRDWSFRLHEAFERDGLQLISRCPILDRDTGKPGELGSSRPLDWRGPWSPERLGRELLLLIEESEHHERMEQFRLDGELFEDPHAQAFDLRWTELPP